MGTITTYENFGGSVGSVTVANVAPSGSDRVMYVGVAVTPYNTATVSSVAFNTSENATQIAERNVSGGTWPHRLEVWRLVAPTATTADVVVTFAATATQAAVLVVCRDDTDQSTPNDTVALGGNASSTAPVITPEFVWGGGDDVQVVLLAMRNTAATFTEDADVTLVDSVQSGSGSSHVRMILVTDAETETGKAIGTFSAAAAFNVAFFNVNEVSAGVSNAPRSMYYALGGMR